MVRSRRRRTGPLLRRAMVVACAGLLPACGLILGLDQGAGLVAGSDASTDATTLHPSGELADAGGFDDSETLGPDGPPADETSPHDGAGPASGVLAADAGAEAGCTPDPSWCDSHCGTGADNCGSARQCSTCSAG